MGQRHSEEMRIVNHANLGVLQTAEKATSVVGVQRAFLFLFLVPVSANGVP